MRRLAARFAISGIFLFLLWTLCAGAPAIAATADTAVQREDHSFLQAAASGDKSKLAGLLDVDFTWTDSDGKTWTRKEVLKDMPKPSIANGADAQPTQHMYDGGVVALVQEHSGRDYVMRVWVKRQEGWRVLVYQETRLLGTAPTAAPGAGKDCDNPCKTVAYEPKNEAERQVIAAYEALETSAEAHNAPVWAGLVADEFLAVSSNGDKAFDKKTRLAGLESSKMRGLAPTPLVSARMFDFGDTVIMLSEHRPDRGKPLHVTRLWVKRDGRWMEVVSYQTTIQGNTAKT